MTDSADFADPADSAALAQRAVAAPQWRWMSGMRWTVGEDWGRLLDEQDRVLAGALPDLDDPATRGCLLALVRAVYGDPLLCAVAHWSGQEARHLWWLDSDDLPVDDLYAFETEAEVLVEALERAGSKR